MLSNLYIDTSFNLVDVTGDDKSYSIRLLCFNFSKSEFGYNINLNTKGIGYYKYIGKHFDSYCINLLVFSISFDIIKRRSSLHVIK